VSPHTVDSTKEVVMEEERDTTEDEGTGAKNADNPEPSDDVGTDPFDGLQDEARGGASVGNDEG
jgi:hypothetical protein